MRKLTSLLLAGGLCAAGTATVIAQAVATDTTVRRSIVLPAAEALDIGGFADVTIAEGSPQQVLATGPTYLLDHAEFEVRQGVLRFRPTGGAGQWLRNRLSERLKISITLPALRKVSLTGSSTITGLTPLTAPELAVVLAGAGTANLNVRNTRTNVFLTGAGNVTLSGSTSTQGVHIQGVGTYHGFGLNSLRTAASISGTGTGEVWATNSLSAQIAGIGIIRYRGQPATIEQGISGLGKLEKSR